MLQIAVQIFALRKYTLMVQAYCESSTRITPVPRSANLIIMQYSPPRKFAIIWRNEQDGISPIKFEAAR